MTHRAFGSGRRIPRIWILPIATLVALLAAAVQGVLSRSLVLDLAAWWPVWLGIVLLALLARGRRLGRLRASGLVPLLAFVALAALLAGHLQGWPVMPSAEARLVGPPVGDGVEAALLQAKAPRMVRPGANVPDYGQIRLRAGTPFLYQIDPIRRGGDIALPSALEREPEEGAVFIALQPRSDPGPYGFAGWDIRLNGRVSWTLVLEGDIDADLSGLTARSVEITGRGRVVLGDVGSPAMASFSGAFEVVVPAGVPVRVEGEATVPEGWEPFGFGSRSPSEGRGWVIAVSGSVTVVEG